MYVCISNKIMEEMKLVPVVYNHPRAFPRAHTSTCFFFVFFFFTRVYRLLFYILNDNDALQLAQLLAHQELFAPTFSFVIQHLLSRILQIKKCRFV